MKITQKLPLEDNIAVPEDCLNELKSCNLSHNMLVSEGNTISPIVNFERFSVFKRLLRITAWVMKCIEILKLRGEPSAINSLDINRAEVYWITIIQQALVKDERFDNWHRQFDLFKDERGLWRCRGRLGKADIPENTRHPVLLYGKHYLTLLIVQECHERVFHGGVKDTLTEIRARYWIIKGRSLVRKCLQQQCKLCQRFHSKPLQGSSSSTITTVQGTGSTCFHIYWS